MLPGGKDGRGGKGRNLSFLASLIHVGLCFVSRQRVLLVIIPTPFKWQLPPSLAEACTQRTRSSSAYRHLINFAKPVGLCLAAQHCVCLWNRSACAARLLAVCFVAVRRAHDLCMVCVSHTRAPMHSTRCMQCLHGADRSAFAVAHSRSRSILVFEENN